MFRRPHPAHLHFRLWLTLLFLAATLVAVTAPAVADSPEANAAKRTDAQIAKLVKQLEGKLAKKPDLKKAPAAVLYHSFQFDSGQAAHVSLRNEILLINDTGCPAAMSRTYSYPAQTEISYKGGWVWRKGKVIRLDESTWTIDAPDDKNPLTASVTFPELKKGDLVCYTAEAKAEYPFTGKSVRLSGDLPVMISNTRVKTGGHFSLEFLGYNLVKKKFAKKVYEEKDKYPIDLKFTVVDIPADRTGEDAPPFYEYQPHLLVYPKAQYNEYSEAWMETKSWNMVAVMVSGYRTHLEDRISVVKSKAESLTAGLDNDAAKADVLFGFIQDDIALVCFFDDYNSAKLEDLLADLRANRMGKSALMYTMCRAVDLPVDVLLSRDRQLGNIDRTAYTMNQFTDFIIVLKGDSDRYYVPTTAPCPAGELPPGLKGLNALATKPDLKEPFRALAIEASSRSSGNPENSSAVFNGMLNQEDWSNWIVLP